MTTFSDSASDVLGVEGIVKLFQDVNLDILSINALIFNWKLGFSNIVDIYNISDIVTCTVKIFNLI